MTRFLVPELPLSRHPFVRTNDLDEARQIFSRTQTPIRAELVDRRTPFSWMGNAVRIGSVFFGASVYGGSACSRTDAVEDVYSMTFALGDVGAEAVHGRKPVTVVKGEVAWLSSPRAPSSFRYGTGYRALNVSIPRQTMEEALTVLGGAPHRELLRFDSHVSLRTSSGAALQRLLLFATEEANREDHSFTSPLVAARFIDSIVFAMLLGQAHNHSASLQTKPAAPGPRSVKRAAEYLAANAARPIRMRDLVQLTGVSGRALQQGFAKHHGRSPMAFLADRRLELARAQLLTRTASTIAQIARACGFENAGRFSALYRARFGEAPSATRAKAQ